MREVKNYLDIQLRDMDYANNYPGNLRLKFLDLDHKYRDDDIFEQRYNEALNKAKDTLTLKMANTKVESNPALKVLINLYKQRLEKEKYFIMAFEREFGIDRKDKSTKVSYPMNGDYTLSTSRAYAYQFSNFITQALGAQDNEIIKCLRSDDLAEKLSGLASKVFSTRASEGHRSKKTKQSEINLYYENLFTTFFFGKRIKKNQYAISLEDMQKQGPTIGSKVFKQKFMDFINTYYSAQASPEFAQKIRTGLNSLGEECAERIYRNFNENNPQYFQFTRNKSRGVSKLTEQQLKKMLLQTIREIAIANGDNVDAYTIPGLLEVHNEWREQEGRFNMVVQTQIDEMKNRRREIKQAKAEGRLINGKKVDMRNYSRTYLVQHEDDLVQGLDGGKTQVKDLFLTFINQNIESVIGRAMTTQEKTMLSRAFFQKIDKTIKRGDRALNAMSAYGPTQMKGLLGEVATAYSIQLANQKSKNGAYSEVTGGDRAGAGGQLHYDVVARIAQTTVGFQVKNYKTTKLTKLYDETVHMGRKEMFKYFDSDDVKSYRWLFANGVYLTKTGDIPNLRQQMELSFFNSISNFLRITDASVSDQIQSDIYVIGNYYLPSSYLIAAAIDKVKRELESKDGQKMFTLNGSFPAYRRKAKPKPLSYDRENGTHVEKMKFGNVGMPNKNIMYINESAVLNDAEIYFSGITINFKI